MCKLRHLDFTLKAMGSRGRVLSWGVTGSKVCVRKIHLRRMHQCAGFTGLEGECGTRQEAREEMGTEKVSDLDGLY